MTTNAAMPSQESIGKPIFILHGHSADRLGYTICNVIFNNLTSGLKVTP